MQAPFTRAVPQPPDPGQEITAPRLSSNPDAQQLQGVRGWFKRAVAVLLMVTLTLSSTGQAIAQASNLITSSNGRPFTGYRADGTYVQAAYGGSFGDNLLQAAINAGTDTVAESAANWIGSTFPEGSLGNYAAHAALGCAAGAARGGSSEGCGAGAAGAVVGNWAGQQVHQNLNSNDPNTLLVAAAGLDGQSFNSVGALASNLAGGFAGALVGGSSGDDVAAATEQVNAASIAKYDLYRDELRAVMSKPSIVDPELIKIVDPLYRTNATVGSGSTAAAVRQ